MARPYSADLRNRVLLAHEHGEGGATALARRFRIGLSTLYRWLGDLRDEGRRAARPMGHGRAPLGGAEDVLRALVAEQNDATLAEYAERFAARTGRRRSPSAICRALRRLDLPRKKSRSVRRSGATNNLTAVCASPGKVSAVPEPALGVAGRDGAER